MSEERDPRVVAVAEKLALAYPYGFDYVKSGPSAADYHAAIVAVKTLDEMEEYEYNIQATDTDDGEKFLCRGTWESDTEWLERKLAAYNESAEEMGRTYKIVKRRKAGKVEDV